MSAFKKRSFLAIIVSLIVFVLVISSFVYLSFQKLNGGIVGSVIVGIPFSEAASLFFVANDQQYFSSNGLDVTFKSYPSGQTAVQGMLNGESDVSGAAEFVFASQVLHNANAYAVGNVCQYLSIYVVGRKDEGINAPLDLKGKTIGVALGTSHQFFLGQFLELNGIGANQVTILNIPFTQQPDAISNGTIDAVVTTPPYLGQVENSLGNKSVTWSAQAGQPGYGTIICSKNWATSHPDLVERVLKALVQAEDFVVNSPNQAVTIVAKSINYTVPYLSSIWSEYRFSVTLDQSFVLLVENEAHWLIANNLTNATSVPNVLNYVQPDGLTAVKPQAVNIIGA